MMDGQYPCFSMPILIRKKNYANKSENQKYMFLVVVVVVTVVLLVLVVPNYSELELYRVLNEIPYHSLKAAKDGSKIKAKDGPKINLHYLNYLRKNQ